MAIIGNLFILTLGRIIHAQRFLEEIKSPGHTLEASGAHEIRHDCCVDIPALHLNRLILPKTILDFLKS